MRRRRGLSQEEARLWAGVARQARPLPGKALPELPEPDESLAGVPRAAAKPAAKERQGTAGVKAPPAAKPPAPVRPSLMPSYQAPVQARAASCKPTLAPAPRPTALPSLHPIEKPVKRKIGAGRVAIDDRIDLHDKTQIVAHYALLGFLRQAQANGFRHVLVITGRGASFGSRGVIKRSLPHWFGTPDFRSLVAGYEPAERHHGGDGAFYVRVRRR